MSTKKKTKKKHSNSIRVDHVDQAWIYTKIGGHGGSFGSNGPYDLARIGYIGNKNFIQVFWYNIILYFRYLKRRFKRTFGGG